METAAIISTINAYADLIQAYKNAGEQFPGPGRRDATAKTFFDMRDQYVTATQTLDTWKEVESLGNGIVILSSPEGLRIRYIPENGVERLETII